MEARLRAALAERYRVEGEIGRGGMATVWLAEDLKHHRKVALKVLTPEAAQAVGAERFLREIEIAASLVHPHLLPVFDSGEADGLLFYVMPRITGGSLRERLAREGPLPVAEAVTLAREVADALHHAHEAGVVHRDVKPANILLAEGHALVADFGVARALVDAGPGSLTRTGMSVGTPTYMSPEQITGDEALDARSDQYALGCVLFEMLAGRPPFDAPSGERVVRQHLAVEPPDLRALRRDVPKDVAAATRRALAKDPAKRFPSIQAFGAALTGAGGDRERRTLLSRRPLLVTAAAALAALAILSILGPAVRGLRDGLPRGGTTGGERPYTVLASVEGSADLALRETAEFLLRSALDGAEVVRTVPSGEVERVLGLMERSKADPLDAATARELAQRLGVSTFVHARLDVLGTSFLLAARVEDVAGALVAEASHRAPDLDRLVETVEAVSADLRRDLGESRAALANTEPLPAVLTRSMAALQKYREALALHRNFLPGQAVPLFREALALDPEFSAAHAALAASLHNAGLPDSIVLHLRLALQHPERLPETVRKNTEADLRYSSDFALWDDSFFRTGNRNYDVLRLADFQYFDSARALNLEDVKEAVRLERRFDPVSVLSTEDDNRWRNALRLAITTGTVAELDAFVDSLDVETGEYWELMKSFDAGDWDRADSIHTAAPDAWESHIIKRMSVAALDAVRGRIGRAAEVWTRIFSRRLSSGRVDLVFSVLYGLPARSTAESLSDRGLDAVERYVAHGVRSALVGDTVAALRVSRRMQAARDSATSRLFESAFEPSFALLDAGLAGRRGDWAEAVRRLEPCLRRLTTPGYGFPTDRYLVRWVLADAYVRLGHADAAVEQLDALLRERSLDPVWVLFHVPAHLTLARLLEAAGDPAASTEHYRRVVEALTDPDPGLQWMADEAREALGRPQLPRDVVGSAP